MSMLYQIETDMRFERRPCDPRRFDSVVEQFGLAPATAASEIGKDNRLSILVVARCGDEEVVFRRCDRALSEQVARQCRVFATLQGARVIRPLLEQSGRYCHIEGQGAWTAYRYVPGQLYCDAEHPPFDAIEAALRCVAALTLWEKGHPGEAALLPAIVRDSAAWGDIAARLLDVRWRDAIGEETASLVADAAPSIRDLQRACGEVVPGRYGLTHADLQPANIIAGPEGVTVIDLEDVCRDDVRLSATHAIFKLARHAVFMGLVSVERARAELCVRGLDLARSLGIDVAGQECARQLAARRTLGDISNILRSAENPASCWLLYDLRKKVHNLFELADMFGEPLAVRQAV